MTQSSSSATAVVHSKSGVLRCVLRQYSDGRMVVKRENETPATTGATGVGEGELGNGTVVLRTHDVVSHSETSVCVPTAKAPCVIQFRCICIPGLIQPVRAILAVLVHEAVWGEGGGHVVFSPGHSPFQSASS